MKILCSGDNDCSFLAKFSTFYFLEYFDYRSKILTNIIKIGTIKPMYFTA